MTEKCITHIPNTQIYLGNAYAAKTRSILDKYDITAIVNVGGGKCHFPDLQYLKVSLKDSDDDVDRILSIMPKVCEFLEHHLRRTKVLVHCRGGMNRSPAVVAAYLAWSTGLPPEEAFRRVRAVRPAARFNRRFDAAVSMFLETCQL